MNKYARQANRSVRIHLSGYGDIGPFCQLEIRNFFASLLD